MFIATSRRTLAAMPVARSPSGAGWNAPAAPAHTNRVLDQSVGAHGWIVHRDNARNGFQQNIQVIPWW